MIPLAIHQLKKILRDLSSGSVKACGPFIVPWRCPGPWETRHWCRLMRENDDDTWCYNPHWIGMNMGWLGCFFLSTVATKYQFDETLILARYHNKMFPDPTTISGAPRCHGTCWTFRRPLDWFLAEKFHWVHQDVSGDLCSFMEHVPWNMSDLLIDFVYVCIL